MVATDLGSLILELKLDSSSFDKSLQEIHRTTASWGKLLESKLHLKPTVDFSELHELNDLLDVKRAHFFSVNRDFRRNPLKPSYDGSAMAEMSEELDDLRKQYNQIQRFLVSNKLTPSVDLDPLYQLKNELQSVKTEINSLQSELKTPLKADVDISGLQAARAELKLLKEESAEYTKMEARSGVSTSGRGGRQRISVKQQSPGLGQRVVDTASNRIVERAVNPLADLAFEEGFTRLITFTSKTLKETVSSIKFAGVGKEFSKELDKVTQKAIDIYAPEKGVTGRVEKTIEEIKKPVKIIDQQRKSMVGSAIKMGLTPITKSIEGLYFGIGGQYGAKMADGAIEALEEKMGKTLKDVGREAGGMGGALNINALDTIVGKQGKLGQIRKNIAPVLEKYGIDANRSPFDPLIDSLDAVEKSTARVGSMLSQSLDENQIAKDLEDVKEGFIGVAKAIVLTKDEAQKLEAIARSSKGLQGLVSHPKTAVVSRYKQGAKSSADAIRSGQFQDRLSMPMRPMEALEDGHERIAIISGGFAGAKGQGTHNVIKELEPHIPKNTKVVPFENTDFDVDTSAEVDPAGWVKSVFDKVSDVMEKGYNPAAVRMAAEAHQYSQANPDKPIDLIGYSAGGLIAKEAQEILKHLGIKANVLSMGSPNLASFSGMREDSISMMGKGDPLAYLADKTSPSIEGVGSHSFTDYMGDPQVQEIVKKYLTGGVTEELRQMAKGVMPDNTQPLEEVLAPPQQPITTPVENTVKPVVPQVEKPVIPPVDQESIDAAKSGLMGLTRKELGDIAKSLKMTGVSKLNKSDISDQIINKSGTDYVKQLVKERQTLNEFLKQEEEIGKKIADVNKNVKMSAEDRTQALADLRQQAVKMQDDADKALRAMKDPGTRMAMGATLGRTSKRLQSTLGITPDQVAATRKALETKDIPENVTAGFVKQLDKDLGDVTEAGIKFAQEFISAVKEEFEIRSPSRVFMEIGKFVKEGFLKGIVGVDEGIKQFKEFESKARETLKQNQQARATQRQINNVRLNAVEQRGRDVMSQANQAVQPMENRGKAVVNQYIQSQKEATKQQFKNMLQSGREFIDEFVNEFKQSNPKVVAAFEGFLGAGELSLKKLAGLFIGFKATEFLVKKLFEMIPAALDVSREFNRMGRTFEFAYGSLDKGKEVISGIRKEAKALGLDLRQALQGQAQIAAATKGGQLEGYATDLGGRAVRQAVQVSGLSNEAAERAYTAVSQILAKNSIQQEELKGQLAEVGGVFANSQAIMARSLGMDVSELQTAMQRGEVLANEAAPKFFQQLLVETSGASDSAANSSTATLNRYNNAILELQETLGNKVNPVNSLGLTALTKVIEGATTGLGVFVDLIRSAAITLVIGIADKIGFLKVALTVLKAPLVAVTALLKGLNNVAKSSVTSFQGLTIGIYAATQVFNIIQDRYSNLGGYVQKFANEAESAIKRYAKAIEDANKKQLKKPDGGDTDSFLGSLVPNMPGQRQIQVGVTGAERSFQENVIGNPVAQAAANAINKVFGTNLKPGTSFRDIRSQEEQEARTQVFSGGRDALLAAKELLNGSSGDQLQQIVEIDRQVREAQSRRRALLPGNVAGRQAIDKQLEGLQQQRESVSPAVANVQMLNGQMIELFKKLKDEAFTNQDLETYRKASEILDQLTEQQNKLNVALQGSIDPLGRLNRAFADIQGTLNSALRSIDQTLNSSKRSIAAAQINGATPGQLEFARSGVDIRNMQQRLGANQNAIQSQSDLLMNDSDIKGFSKAITDRLGVSSLMDLDPAQVSAQVSALSDSVDKDVLTKFNEEYERLLSLKSETDNLSTQIAEAKAQAVQRMRDLATSVYDLYRSIDNQSKELALQTEQIQLQAEQARIQINTQSQQNKLKQALSGFSDSFLNEFVDNLINLVDQLNKPLEAQNQLDQQFVQAQQQMLQAQQQYGDQIRQIYGLSNQLPDQSQLAGITSETPGAGQVQTESQASNAYAKEDSNAQPGGFSPMALIDPADIERQVQAQLAAQRQNQSLTTGGVSGGNIPGLDVALDNPQAVKAQMDALRGLTPQDAMNAAQSGLSESAQKAYQNYTQQLKNIQTQYDTASAQAQAQIEQSSTEIERLINQMGIGLRNVNRQIADTTRGFSRSIEDLQNEGMSQTAFGQLGGQLRGYDRGAEDQTIQLQRFREQLVATIDQAGAAYDQISGQIASGLMPAEEGQALLSGLTRTAGNAQNALSDITGQMKALSAATAEASQRAIELFKRQQSLDMNAARTESLRLQGLDSEAQASEFGSRANQLGFDAQQQKNELQALYDQGLINNDQFKEMSASLEQLNNLKLDNLRQEFKNLSQDKTFSALFGEKADRRSQRQNLKRFRDNLQDALQSGSIGRDEYRRLYRMSTTVGEKFIEQSDTQRIRTLRENQGNTELMKFLEGIGIGNAGAIASLSFNDAMNTRIGELRDKGYGVESAQYQAGMEAASQFSDPYQNLSGQALTSIDRNAGIVVDLLRSISVKLNDAFPNTQRSQLSTSVKSKSNDSDMALRSANL